LQERARMYSEIREQQREAREAERERVKAEREAERLRKQEEREQEKAARELERAGECSTVVCILRLVRTVHMALLHSTSITFIQYFCSLT
jgi:hypothetical protein